MSDYISAYLDQIEQVIHHLSREAVAAVVDALEAAWRADRQIFLIGNGGSAATASHMMNDLNKATLADGKPRVRALALTDNVPLLTAWGNDSTYEDVFVEPLLNFMRAGDVLVAISASGNSPNVVKAAGVAREHGLQVIALTGDRGGRLAEMAHLAIHIPSPLIGQQEDGHMILDHVIAGALRERIARA